MGRLATINISANAMRLLIASGYTFSDIATIYRVSSATVTRTAKRYRIVAPYNQQAEVKRAAVRDIVTDSDSPRPTAEIATQLGLPPSTVRRYRKSVELAGQRAAMRSAPAHPSPTEPKIPAFARDVVRMMRR